MITPGIQLVNTKGIPVKIGNEYVDDCRDRKQKKI